MSLSHFIKAGRQPRHHNGPRPAHRAAQVIIAPSDDEVQARLSKARLIMDDGPVPVEGKIIGWKRNDAGALSAIVVNELTNVRALFAVDFKTRRPRLIAWL